MDTSSAQPRTAVSSDPAETIEHVLARTQSIPGFLVDNEARFLGTLAAVTPAKGNIVEIGSFKGKSTAMLASMAARFGHEKVVAIDPHGGLSYLGGQQQNFLNPTFEEFLTNIKSAAVENHVEVHRAVSRDVAKDWNRPIRVLWIDGDHTYRGCKEDFDLFAPYLADGAVVALHDSLNTFEGPIRVFVEEILRSDRFGPSGFVHSIAWSQYRPADGAKFREQRRRLERCAAPLLPFLRNDAVPTGLRKKIYKFRRSLVPRKYVSPDKWVALVTDGMPFSAQMSSKENRRSGPRPSAASSSARGSTPSAPDASG